MLLMERFIGNIYIENIQIEFVRQKFTHYEARSPIINYNTI